MNKTSTLFIVQWEAPSDDGFVPLVVLAGLWRDFTIFDYASSMYANFGIVMVDYKQIDNDTKFDDTDPTSWITIQDAIDSIIKE